MLSLLFHGAFSSGPLLVDSDGNPYEYGRQQTSEGLYMRQQLRLSVLYSLFGGTFAAESDVTRFITAFNSLIASPTLLTPGELNFLDFYDDGVVGYDDRDYWLNRVIEENFSVTDRLSWADSTPTTYAESDPLGLTTGRSNCIIIDPLNTAAVYVAHSSNNPCYLVAARTGSNTTLFDSTSLSGQYRSANMLWGDFRSLVGDSGNSSRYRFPKDGGAVTVYIRGGDHTLAYEATFVKEDGSATANSRIIVRNYPGEVVNIYSGNAETSAGVFNDSVMMTISRPDFWLSGFRINGYRVEGSNRIFGHKAISITAAATNARMYDMDLYNYRAIAPTHTSAGALPQYVDYAFTGRTLDADENTGKMLDAVGINIGLNNSGTLLQDVYIYPAGDDFPRSVTVPGGSTEHNFGHSLDISGTTNTTLRRVTIAGTGSHQAITAGSSGATQMTGFLMEYCDIRNPENSCVGFGGEDCIIRYNRIHHFGSRDGSQDGHGIQIGHSVDCQYYGNVIWLDDDQSSGQTFGIDFGITYNDSAAFGTGNTIEKNIFVRCGMSFGYTSSPVSPAIGRVHDNTIRYNVFYDLSEYARTEPAYDAPITTNVGPHIADMYDNVFQLNLFYRTDGDTACIAERTPSGTTDYPISPMLEWFTGNVYGDPGFADIDDEDFSVPTYLTSWTILGDDLPFTAAMLAGPVIFKANTDVPNVNRRVQSEVTTYSRT